MTLRSWSIDVGANIFRTGCDFCFRQELIYSPDGLLRTRLIAPDSINIEFLTELSLYCERCPFHIALLHTGNASHEVINRL